MADEARTRELEAWFAARVVAPTAPAITRDGRDLHDPLFVRERPADIYAVPIGTWWYASPETQRHRACVFEFDSRRGVMQED